MTKEVLCPTCGQATHFSIENLHRPFCSDRCKLIDLGAWATEEYKIPEKTTTQSFVEEDSLQFHNKED